MFKEELTAVQRLETLKEELLMNITGKSSVQGFTLEIILEWKEKLTLRIEELEKEKSYYPNQQELGAAKRSLKAQKTILENIINTLTDIEKDIPENNIKGLIANIKEQLLYSRALKEIHLPEDKYLSHQIEYLQAKLELLEEKEARTKVELKSQKMPYMIYGGECSTQDCSCKKSQALSNLDKEEIIFLIKQIGSEFPKINSIDPEKNSYKFLSFNQEEISDIQEKLDNLNNYYAYKIFQKLNNIKVHAIQESELSEFIAKESYAFLKTQKIHGQEPELMIGVAVNGNTVLIAISTKGEHKNYNSTLSNLCADLQKNHRALKIEKIDTEASTIQRSLRSSSNHHKIYSLGDKGEGNAHSFNCTSSKLLHAMKANKTGSWSMTEMPLNVGGYINGVSAPSCGSREDEGRGCKKVLPNLLHEFSINNTEGARTTTVSDIVSIENQYYVTTKAISNRIGNIRLCEEKCAAAHKKLDITVQEREAPQLQEQENMMQQSIERAPEKSTEKITKNKQNRMKKIAEIKNSAFNCKILLCNLNQSDYFNLDGVNIKASCEEAERLLELACDFKLTARGAEKLIKKSEILVKSIQWLLSQKTADILEGEEIPEEIIAMKHKNGSVFLKQMREAQFSRQTLLIASSLAKEIETLLSEQNQDFQEESEIFFEAPHEEEEEEEEESQSTCRLM